MSSPTRCGERGATWWRSQATATRRSRCAPGIPRRPLARPGDAGPRRHRRPETAARTARRRRRRGRVGVLAGARRPRGGCAGRGGGRAGRQAAAGRALRAPSSPSSTTRCTWSRRRADRRRRGSRPPHAAACAAPRPRPVCRPVARAIVIACSTGGPQARSPRSSRRSPPTSGAASRSSSTCPPASPARWRSGSTAPPSLTVREARDGERLAPGVALLAPGGFHLRLSARTAPSAHPGARDRRPPPARRPHDLRCRRPLRQPAPAHRPHRNGQGRPRGRARGEAPRRSRPGRGRVDLHRLRHAPRRSPRPAWRTSCSRSASSGGRDRERRPR